jgi:hypothetical protein
MNTKKSFLDKVNIDEYKKIPIHFLSLYLYDYQPKEKEIKFSL